MSGKYRWLGHRRGEIKSGHRKSLKLINCFYMEVSSPGNGREREREREGVGRRDVVRPTGKEEGKKAERKTRRKRVGERKREANKWRRKMKGEEVYLLRVQNTSRHFLLNSVTTYCGQCL